MPAWSTVVTTIALALASGAAVAPAAPAPLVAAPVSAAATRPRVGVALSGGGARGLAHIGVLQWFEEHRIPIDCLAGTSMGGLLGGFTAVGWSPDSLRAFVLGADWDRLFSGTVSWDELALRRKEDARSCPVRFEVGLRWGPRLPSGLNPGQHVMLLLSSVALPESDHESFDDLPTPFRCVATDLASGTPVVLGHGSLAAALRATMAIPGVFEPVWWEGHLLADGGLVARVPVDAVRGMGADIVVGVDVNVTAVDSVPETVLGVLQRALEIPGQVNAQAQLARADIVIRVDSRDARLTDYARSVAVIDAGYRAAEAQAAQLLPLALAPAAWEAHLAARRPRHAAPPYTPQFVNVEGVPRPEAEWIARGLQRYAGQPLDRSRLERDLNRLVGTGRYASAAYEWQRSGAGRGLRVRVREKPYGPPTLRFGIDANNAYDDLTLTVGARATFIDVTTWGSEARADLALGTAPRAALELFQPLGGAAQATRSRFFIAPRAFFRRDRQDYYEGTERLAAVWRTHAGAGVDAGWIGGTGLQVRTGYETSAVEEDVSLGTLPDPAAEDREQLLRLHLQYEGQDAVTIPRRGVFIDAETRWYMETPGSSGDFGRGTAEAGIALPSRAHDRTLMVLEGQASFGAGAVPAAEQATLGGFLRLGAFRTEEFRDRHAALARITHLVAVGRLGGLSGDRLYAAGSVELGSAFAELEPARGVVSGTLGLVADTAIGPCALGASLGSSGRWRIHFSAGKSIL